MHDLNNTISYFLICLCQRSHIVFCLFVPVYEMENKLCRNRVNGHNLGDRLGVPDITKHLPAAVSRIQVYSSNAYLSPGETR